jgi:hypothetical protein
VSALVKGFNRIGDNVVTGMLEMNVYVEFYDCLNPQDGAPTSRTSYKYVFRCVSKSEHVEAARSVSLDRKVPKVVCMASTG